MQKPFIPGPKCFTHSSSCGQTGPRDGDRFAPRIEGRAAQRGYDATWQLFREGYFADHPLCAICGLEGARKRAHLHHVMPLKAGGPRLERWNVRRLCESCHSRVTLLFEQSGGFRRVLIRVGRRDLEALADATWQVCLAQLRVAA